MRLGTGGFTLLEVLLAAALLTFGLVFVIGTISTGLFSGAVNEAELVAINLIQEKAEEIRNVSYANVAPGTEAQVDGFTQFQRVVAITQLTDLKQATVTVSWSTKGDQSSLSLVTYVSDV